MVLLLALLLHAVAPRERAVLVYPREHVWFRRVFYNAHQRRLQRELAKRFDLEVHDQVGTAGALFAVDLRGAKLLVLSGHGSAYGMSLAGRKERTLDSSMEERLRRFLSQLAPDATIVLQSCDTGRGFAWTVKEAAGAGRHVIAADGEVPPDGLNIASLQPLDVTIVCRESGGRTRDCKVRL